MCSGFSRTAEQSEGFSHTIVVADAVRECGTIADGLACGVFAAEGADGLALFDGEGGLGRCGDGEGCEEEGECDEALHDCGEVRCRF